MATTLLTYAPGQTPLDPDEVAGLIPTHITTQGELDAWELANIARAQPWAWRYRGEMLDDVFVRELHARMFRDTWRWAGTFRLSDKNIGIDWRLIPQRVRQLTDNARWQRDQAQRDMDELAVWLHHQLVWIHLFPNGNGRHARLMADLLAVHMGRLRFTWGANANLIGDSQIRSDYLAALRHADLTGDCHPLLQFARR